MALPDVVDQVTATTRAFLHHHGARDALRGGMLAAVSGGADSTALALVLARLRDDGALPGPLWIGHVDHRVRPGSAADEARVRALASSLDVPFARRALALKPPASESDMRDGRYAALTEMAVERGAVAILTAHHADDDIETVLFRMMRGTGTRGLAGIPAIRRDPSGLLVLRPFLELRRAVLEEVVRACGRQALVDPTNDDLGRARNRIRHLVLPTLRSSSCPGADEHLLSTKRTARAVTERRSDAAALLIEQHAVRVAPWRIELESTVQGDAGSEVVAEVLRQVHVALRGQAPRWSWIERARAVLEGPVGRRHHGPGVVLVERARDRVLVIDAHAAGPPQRDCRPLTPGGASVALDGTGWLVTARDAEGDGGLRIDARAAGGGLALRTPRRGDRFWPFGTSGPRRLRGYLARRGVPRFDRDRLPLVVDADDSIVCIPGIEVAHPARVRTGSAFRILREGHRA